jgi:hypothetical protein
MSENPRISDTRDKTVICDSRSLNLFLIDSTVTREKSIGITETNHGNSLQRYTLRLEKCVMTRCKFLLPAALCGVLVGAAGFVSADTGEELAKYAKVSLADARAIARKAFPGRITDEELEKEKGGSGLRYSFDIKNGGVTHEVGVDAKTGKLLENSAVRPQAD